MKAIVLKELPFARVGEEVEYNDGYLEPVVADGPTIEWPPIWPDPFSSGWLGKKRWKPKEGEEYYTVFASYYGIIVDMYCYCESRLDKFCVKSGNCFQTREQAEELARRWRKVMEEYREEIGV